MTFGFVAAFSLLQAPAGGGGGSFTPLLFQFGLIFLIFYFLIIRPQQKQRKAHDTALKSLKRGERVVTAGGIIGEVIHIKESVKEGVVQPTMEDEVTIKSGDTRFINERGRIARIVTSAGESTSAPKESRST
ncbi:MAG TPA: preprotein translocase subunit YajC [Gemmatimonadaceae bacterium]|nr:preprotein translocase subunit YajC [Gemmatimonadaceae bacterium]